MNNANFQNKYDRLLFNYFDSQAYAYVLISILFLTKYYNYTPIFIFGWIFLGVSIIVLLAPICAKAKSFAVKLDKWFQGGLFVACGAAVILEGWIGALNATNSILFWVLVSWLFLMIIQHALRISKRIGIYKFISFGLAAFGLLMIVVGYRETIYYTITIIGLLVSMPALDEVLNKLIKHSR